jgi:hypothetical protein
MARVLRHNDKDALILNGVRPLFQTLAGRVSAVSSTRQWKFGPHLRLNVRTGAVTFADVVRPAVDEIIRGSLKRCPSSDERRPTVPFVRDRVKILAPLRERAARLAAAERFLLCRLVTNTVEERYGVSALDLIGAPPVGA